MARTNLRPKNNERTHEGAVAAITNAEQQLRRSVMSCLLFESEFYEDGEEISSRIKRLAEAADPAVVSKIAIEARALMHLRHAPLLLLEVLSRTGAGRTDGLVSRTIWRTIQRADEMAEFIAIYTRGGDRRTAKKGHGRQFSAQMMKGIALALPTFDAYQLAKYDRAGKVKLKDVFRIVRPKPANDDQAKFWKAAVDGTLPAPDTWEVALSGGADKKEAFTRLLTENKLGYMALLRNLRNMAQADVDRDLVIEKIKLRKGAARVLPFRYIAAARAAPQFEPAIDQALIASIEEAAPFTGRTLILVDVSGSMDHKLSAKADLTRVDAAAALASIMPGEDVRVMTFSNNVIEVPRRLGMAGVEVILRSQMHSGTYLGKAVEIANQIGGDRIVVISDEQTADRVPDPAFKFAYMINVASNKNGVGYGKWTHIDGFSESVFKFMRALESDAAC